MKSIRLKTHVDSNGLLKIQLPEHHDEEVELLIVYQPAQQAQKRQWSQKFLSLFGAWQGEPLERPPQDSPSERLELL
ncbi:MAG: hypothetical protein AAF703_18155 [Cyanobacteria bacterium P01_D01_bin.105]